MEKVAIITSGYFPVPASLGGAVENLDENIMKQNDIHNRMDLIVFSCYEKKSRELSKFYKNTKIIFVKTPRIFKVLDLLTYQLVKTFFKSRKSFSYRYIFQRLHFINKVSKNLKNNDYDKLVIENHSTLFMVLKKYKNFEKYKNKYYYHLHNKVTKDYGCLEIISNCKKVIGVSNYINKTLHDFLGDDDKNEYVVLKNKVDSDKFGKKLTENDQQSLLNKYDIQINDVVFLFTGRFTKEKGIKELLEAYKRINKTNTKLLVVGSLYYGSGMKDQFEEEMIQLTKSLADNVKFTGFVSYDEIPSLYALADVVIIPSIWDDPAPLTVIEALTSGKSLITTYSGGIPEYADDKSSIILKRDENLIQNLASYMNKIANSKYMRDSLEKQVKEKTKNWNLSQYYLDFCDSIELDGGKNGL